MSITKATELINSAMVLMNLLDKRIATDFNARESHHKILDIETVLLEAKEELKDYKL